MPSGLVAQLVEQSPEKACVAGSIPAQTTIEMKNISIIKLIKKFFHKIKKNILVYLFIYIYGRIYFNSNLNKNNKFYEKKINIDHLKYSVFVILNGRLYTDMITNVAYIINNQLIEGPSIQLKDFIQASISNNIVLKSGTPRILKKINGKVLSTLIGGSGNNYWHWLFEVLPRIFIYEKFYSINELDKILVPSLEENFQIQTLSLLEINIKNVIDSNFYKHIKTKELYATNNSIVFDIEKVPFWIISELRNRFLKKIRKNHKFDKIYIDRSDSKGSKFFRRIINEKEIINFLVNKNFKIIKLSEFSFLDQISIFNNAKYIVGLHGAGFANVVFCKKNTNILEIKPKNAGDVIKNLSLDSDLVYKNINLTPLDKPVGRQFGSLYLPVSKLEHYVK